MEKIINQVKSNWSKDLIIRYLYIKLAPFFKRDLEYFLASDEEKERQFKEGFINRFPNIVCSTLADYYVDLFHEFGIDAKKVIATSSKIPLFALIVKGELGWFFLDPISDLFANQYGLRPYFFGIIPRYKTINRTHPEIKKLPHEYVDYLDQALEFKYLDNFFQELHSILVNRKSAIEFFNYPPSMQIDLRDRKLQFFNDELINLGTVSGAFERAQLYKYLTDRLFDRREKHHSKIWIQDTENNPHIAFELAKKEGNILYEEERQNNQYILRKK